MSANDATNRQPFGIELGQYDSNSNPEDELLRDFISTCHTEIVDALPGMHSKIRNASIAVGADDADVIYGLIRNAHHLLEHSKTVPGRLSQVRLQFLLDGLLSARAAYEMPEQRVCTKCGCSDWDACANGCWWVTEELCSNCAPAQLRRGMGH